MRRLASLVLLVTSVALTVMTAGPAAAKSKESFPAFTAPVVDAADAVPDDVEQVLADELLGFQQRTGMQLAVAVIDTTGDTSLEDYTIDLAREWGVGEKDKDNGVLLLIAMGDRKVRIEVGRGVEGDLTDLESGRIIREVIIPGLRAGDVGGAVQNGTSAIRVALGDPEAQAPLAAPTSEAPDKGSPLLGLGGLAFFVVAAMAARRFGGPGRGGGITGGRGGIGAPIIWGSGFGGGGFGGGGGGGFGGGFGGGGGGGFGGGGSSGGW